MFAFIRERLSVSLTVIGLVALLVALVYKMVHGMWSDAFLLLQALLLGIIPLILRYRYNIYTPPSLYAGIVLFTICTIFLGEGQDFYNEFWWWDILLHTVAGAGLALIAFIILLVVFNKKELRVHATLVSLYATCFSAGLMMLWEIYEFMIDLFFDPENPMQPSNFDTMTDLIVGLAGASFVAVFGYLYIRYRYDHLISEVIKDGEMHNATITR